MLQKGSALTGCRELPLLVDLIARGLRTHPMDSSTSRRFSTRLRVRHYEMDALGHVNNAVYLHYLEQAAIEHSEHLGMSMARYEELGGVFVMRKLEIEYLSPAVAGDTLEVVTWAEEMSGPRAVRKYEITIAGTGRTVARATALWVWIERGTGRPRPIPPVLLAAFAAVAKTEQAGERP